MCVREDWRDGGALTRNCWAAWSFLRSSLSRSSFSCRRSGCFSSLVLLRRLTMTLSRWGITRRLTCAMSVGFIQVVRREDQGYLFVVLEAHLAHSHAAVLFEVGPWRVDDGDVVLFVAWWAHELMFSRLVSLREADSPSIELALVSWPRSVRSSSGMLSHVSPSRRRR